MFDGWTQWYTDACDVLGAFLICQQKYFSCFTKTEGVTMSLSSDVAWRCQSWITEWLGPSFARNNQDLEKLVESLSRENQTLSASNQRLIEENRRLQLELDRAGVSLYVNSVVMQAQTEVRAACFRSEWSSSTEASAATSNNNWTLSGFLVSEKIGSGRFAEVWLGTHQVAMKFVQDKDAFQKERLFLEHLSHFAHPNVARLISCNEDHRCLILPYLHRSLFECMRSNQDLSEEWLQCIMHDVLSGLWAIHTAGVVHGDIKPDNIMISGNAAILVDYNCAEWCPLGGTCTIAGGSLSFSSPERVITAIHDHASDIWSAGVTTFEVLTGQVPFAAPSMDAIKHRIVGCCFDTPSYVSAGAQEFLQACFQAVESRPSALQMLQLRWLRDSKLSRQTS